MFSTGGGGGGGGGMGLAANSKTKEAGTMKLCTIIVNYR